MKYTTMTCKCVKLLVVNVSVIHEIEKNKGWALFYQQFIGMLLKRVIYTWRNRVLTLSQIILPILFTSLGIIVLNSRPVKEAILVKRHLNLSMFDSTEVRLFVLSYCHPFLQFICGVVLLGYQI